MKTAALFLALACMIGCKTHSAPDCARWDKSLPACCGADDTKPHDVPHRKPVAKEEDDMKLRPPVVCWMEGVSESCEEAIGHPVKCTNPNGELVCHDDDPPVKAKP